MTIATPTGAAGAASTYVSDQIQVVVINAAEADISADIEAIRHQPEVDLCVVNDPSQIGSPHLVVLPDSPMDEFLSRSWQASVANVDGALVMGIGLGYALLCRTTRRAAPSGWGWIDADVIVGLATPPRQRRGTVMGAEVIGVETGVLTAQRGPDAAGWVHLSDGHGSDEDGAVRLTDARILGTGLTGLFTHAAFRDVFLTEIGRRARPGGASSAVASTSVRRGT